MWAQTAAVPSPALAIQAVKATQPPVIDGDVDPGEWQGVVAATNFIQYEPRRGDPSEARTERRTHLNQNVTVSPVLRRAS